MTLTHPPVKGFHQKPLFTGKKFFKRVSSGQEMFGISGPGGNRKLFGDFFKLNIQAVFIWLF
jgi:hypothetical protein